MNAVSKYFTGEKIQCIIGIVLALISITIAFYLLFQIRKPFYTGISYSFIVIATLLLIICVGVVIRTPKDISRVTNMLQTNQASIRMEELPRMEAVMKTFRIIKWVEIGFVVAGLLLFFSVGCRLVVDGAGDWIGNSGIDGT